MVKALLPFLLLTLPSLTGSFKMERPNYLSYLQIEKNERDNYTVTGINPSYRSSRDIRICSYGETIIDEIDDEAFLGCTFKSLVISKDVIFINDAAFANGSTITSIEYTGSLADFSNLGLSFDTTKVFPYSVDEGFIYYWDSVIRPNENINICDMSLETFSYTYGLYKSLIQTDLDVVNAYVDKADAKIEDSMKELIRIFAGDNSQKKNDEWNQTGAITLIIVIAVIGMTSITVFFLLKTKNIIG